MNRQTAILAALGAVIVAVAFFMLVWQPRNARLAEIQDEIATIEAEQAQIRTRIVELEEVRARAPQIESDIVASQSILPREVALPSALRQLQLAADESGVQLITVSPTRPSPVEGGQPGLAEISLSLQVDGGYFQVVDFLRRVEDPTITPRGIVWDSLAMAPSEYPTLSAALTGSMYALLPAPPVEGEDTEEAETAEDGDEADADTGDGADGTEDEE